MCVAFLPFPVSHSPQERDPPLIRERRQLEPVNSLARSATKKTVGVVTVEGGGRSRRNRGRMGRGDKGKGGRREGGGREADSYQLWLHHSA